jgi:rubrerythrin
MMRSSKNPESGQTFWECTECGFFSKSSKSNVKSHVLKHHIQPSQSGHTSWSQGQSHSAPTKVRLPGGLSGEMNGLREQIESMMTKMHDAATSCTIWLCTECNYSQSMSATSKSKSHKDKMKRHIMRKHIEGGSTAQPLDPRIPTSGTTNHPKTQPVGTVKFQGAEMMTCLKDPETNQTFWKCTECNFFSKSARNAKSKVKAHVLRCHVGSLYSAFKTNYSWEEGQRGPPGAEGEAFPASPQPLPVNRMKRGGKEKTEQELQVEAMMTSMQDPWTRCTIWLCTKCNYSQTKAPESKSKSHKDKMKRHIMRKHMGVEVKASQPMDWVAKAQVTHDPVKAQEVVRQCQY